MLLQTLERPKLTMLLGLMLRIVEYMESWIHDHDDFQFLYDCCLVDRKFVSL